MSELVNRIRSLEQQVLDLKVWVADERSRYVEEVDHSENMAFIISGLEHVTYGEYSVSMRHALLEHQKRRAADELLPPLPSVGAT
jgi:hypothetical protein